MDGVSALSSVNSLVAASGTSSVAVSVLKSTENLMADEMNRLMASLGVGQNVNASA